MGKVTIPQSALSRSQLPLHKGAFNSTTVEFILAPEGSNGEWRKSVKKSAALLRFLAFLALDPLFGVLRGEQPLSRASRAIGSSGHFFGSFLVSKRNTSRQKPIKKGSHRKVVTPASANASAISPTFPLPRRRRSTRPRPPHDAARPVNITAARR